MDDHAPHRALACATSSPTRVSDSCSSYPASVLVVTVERVFFQCARAVRRSRLWDAASGADPRTLPTAGDLTREATLY